MTGPTPHTLAPPGLISSKAQHPTRGIRENIAEPGREVDARAAVSEMKTQKNQISVMVSAPACIGRHNSIARTVLQ